MEEWRDVVGYEGKYQVSNLGRVKSLGRNIVMSQVLVCKYLRVGLRDGSKQKMFCVHRLVAFAFPEICGEWFKGAEIDHLDGDRNNNIATNLKWVTRVGNRNNPITQQRQSEGKGKWVIRLSLNNEILHFYPSTVQAEKETGVNTTNISNCCLGKQKTAGGFIWKYAN